METPVRLTVTAAVCCLISFGALAQASGDTFPSLDWVEGKDKKITMGALLADKYEWKGMQIVDRSTIWHFLQKGPSLARCTEFTAIRRQFCQIFNDR